MEDQRPNAANDAPSSGSGGGQNANEPANPVIKPGALVGGPWKVREETVREEAPAHSEQAKPAEQTAPTQQQPKSTEAKPEGQPQGGERPPRGERGEGRGRGRGPKGGGQQAQQGGESGGRQGGRGERGERGERGDRGPRRDRPPRGRDVRGGRGGFEGPVEIDLEKLLNDSLYLDDQAHAVVIRMRDIDSGTKSQLRRLYGAVRRAVRTPEADRQHQFVMLRARLAYTIARHSLRSLDGLEKLLLQVTRKNEARGYERFKDLFEAIVAYNE